MTQSSLAVMTVYTLFYNVAFSDLSLLWERGGLETYPLPGVGKNVSQRTQRSDNEPGSWRSGGET